MDAQVVFNVLIVTLLVGVVALRVERRWWWVGVLALVAPTACLLMFWLVFNFNDAVSLLTGVLIGLVLVGGWWFIWGRKLAPTESSIKVWGQEAAPKPKPSQLQAEIDRLRADKEQLETELKRLRGEDNTPR